MKLKLALIAAIFAFGTTTSVSAQNISSIFSKIKSAISTVTGTDSNSIEGTWTYSGADIEFTSDNVLSQVGGKVASSTIESKINSALQKYGIAPNKLSLTFGSDSSYTAAYSSRSTSGTYTFANSKLTLKPSTYSGKTITTNATAGTTLKLTCDADKLLTLIQMIGSKVSSASSNSTISILSTLSKNYKGMKVGLKFKKK